MTALGRKGSLFQEAVSMYKCVSVMWNIYIDTCMKKFPDLRGDLLKKRVCRIVNHPGKSRMFRLEPDDQTLLMISE